MPRACLNFAHSCFSLGGGGRGEKGEYCAWRYCISWAEYMFFYFLQFSLNSFLAIFTRGYFFLSTYHILVRSAYLDFLTMTNKLNSLSLYLFLEFFFVSEYILTVFFCCSNYNIRFQIFRISLMHRAHTKT